MKRSILLFTATAAMAYFTLSSNATGPAKNFSAGDRTGPSGTCGGGGCHGTPVTDATTLMYLKDPISGAAIPINTNYTPTKSYSLVLNTFRMGAVKFGLQISTTDATHSLNLGTLIPIGSNIGAVSSSTTGSIPILEHTAPIVATSGAMSTTNSWIAPNSGKGDVTINTIIVAANGNGLADAGDVYYNLSVTYHEPSAVNDLPSSIGITAYPNPAQSSFKLKFENALNGNYQVGIYDLSGKQLQHQNININNSAEMTINAESLSSGMYLVHVEKDGAQRVVPVTIQ